MFEKRPCWPILVVGGALCSEVRELKPTEEADRPPSVDPARGESIRGTGAVELCANEARLAVLLPPASLPAPSTVFPLLEAVCRINMLVECALEATRPTGERARMGLSTLGGDGCDGTLWADGVGERSSSIDRASMLPPRSLTAGPVGGLDGEYGAWGGRSCVWVWESERAGDTSGGAPRCIESIPARSSPKGASTSSPASLSAGVRGTGLRIPSALSSSRYLSAAYARERGAECTRGDTDMTKY